MRTTTNWAFAAIAAAGLALAGCGGGGSSSSMVAPSTPAATPPATTPEEPTPPTETETAQTEAGMAAEAAKMSSEAAATSAQAAMTAIANLATMQTGATARGLAMEAHAAAADAMAAYATAKEEAAKADAATDTTSAVEARIAAEAAAEEAATAAETAAMKSAAAVAAADNELMIDGKDKSVGTSSLNADDPQRSVTAGDQTTVTGRMTAMDPEHSVEAIAGVAFVAGDGDADPPVADTAYVQAVAARTAKIGRVLDSSDDEARLMLITHYAGTSMVDVFAYDVAADSTTAGDRPTGTKSGYVTIDDNDAATDDTNNTPLKYEGMYILAGAEADTDGLAAADIVAANAKMHRVYSYVTAGTDGTLGTDDDVTNYVAPQSTLIAGSTSTYTYRSVDVMAEASDATTQGTAEEVGVKASIAEATAYKHVHFGVWASLGAAAKDGSQELDSLGIGFVQSIGDGLTGDDMPNNGTASYSGDWAAAVQERDPDGNGDIALVSGPATVMADFSDAEITVTLTNLATLTGAIDGNSYAGTKAGSISSEHGLDASAAFTGTFEGGFYGAKAAETAGIFDFASEDNEGGAFRGAFGGDRD